MGLTSITSRVNKAFSNVRDLVTGQTKTNEKIPRIANEWKVIDEDYKLFRIGRPCKFNSIVDRNQRFGNYLRSKMSVIDLVPVDYAIDFAHMADMVAGKSWDDKQDLKKKVATIYSYGYDKQIAVYKRICAYHGLDEYCGIRLYTTDDTTANDTIQVQYKDSTFQGLSDSLSSFGQQYRDIANSAMGSNMRPLFTDKVRATAIKTVGNVTEKMGGGEALQDLMKNMTSVITDIGLTGNKMTFPKIWQSSTYNGNLSVNVRLISPYGHPKAVKEFIMKPLSYLVLLAAPQTMNGVTYGGSIPITIKAYGMNYTILGSIASITLRRGGSDTSYNLYRQPLTVDVSIEFQTLYDAFAVFDPTEKDPLELKADKDIFESDMLDDPESLNMYTRENNNNLMTTLSTFLSSFRPVRITELDMDPQVYGFFTPPSRDDIPLSPALTPVVGNLGSSISSAVDSVGKFANMVTNAPKLIQQALSNAVYNTAKGSVNSIANTASGWLNAGTSFRNNVVTKVMGNLF